MGVGKWRRVAREYWEDAVECLDSGEGYMKFPVRKS